MFATDYPLSSLTRPERPCYDIYKNTIPRYPDKRRCSGPQVHRKTKPPQVPQGGIRESNRFKKNNYMENNYRGKYYWFSRKIEIN